MPPMKILFISSEVAPFAKTGGLADVAGALPKALAALGHDVRVVMPAYAAIVDKLRMQNPNVRIFVAQIIPLQPDSGKDYDGIVRTLNSAIPAWASELSTETSPITVVDQFTDYVIATDNQADGVHPNAAGSLKIAQNWFDAISSLL